MNNDKNYYSPAGRMARLMALFFLVCSCSANATAPRITADLFGEERKADIVAYQLAPFDAPAKADTALAVDIVMAAYEAAGKTPALDVLPSKHLALYALTSNESLVLLGSVQDLSVQNRKQYSVITFFFRGDVPVSLIFSKTHGKELHTAFNLGLQKIIATGKYQEILEKHQIKSIAEHVRRVKLQNTGWK